MFPIGKFTTIELQQHQYLMFQHKTPEHKLLTLLYEDYTHLNNRRPLFFELFQPKLSAMLSRLMFVVAMRARNQRLSVFPPRLLMLCLMRTKE